MTEIQSLFLASFEGRVSLTCPSCGKPRRSLHNRGCWTCFPEVTRGTPGAVEVAWEARIGDGKDTAARG